MSRTDSAEENFSSQDFDLNFHPTTDTFTISPPNTNLTLQKKITHLESIEKQNILAWYDEFAETCRLCGWNDETIETTLIFIASPKLQYLFQGTNSPQEKFTRILQAKYPPNQCFSFTKELSSIKQYKFRTIKKYVHKLSTVLRKLGISKGLTQEEIENKKQELFYTGLTKRTQLELVRLNANSFEEMFQLISTTEKMIEDQMQERVEIEANIRQHKINERATNNKNFHYRNNNDVSDQKRGRNNSRRFCSFHRTNSHSDEECRRNRRNYESRGNEEKSERRTFFLEEPQKMVKTLEIRIIIGSSEINAILDTGCFHSLIPSTIAKDEHLEIKESKSSRTLTTISKEEIMTSLESEFEFSVKEMPEMKLKTSALVVTNMQPFIILGLKFIQENNCLLDFSTSTIRIKGRSFPLSRQNVDNAEPDREISEKTSALNIQNYSTIQRKIEKLSNMKLKENTFLGVEHSIKLISEKPISQKAYAIPLKLQQQVKDEVKRLLEMKLIRKSQSNFASPAFPLVKRDGSIRLVVDYRKLNAVTAKSAYPFPNMYENFISLRGSTIFSSIDLTQGYYQIPLAKKSIKYSAFILPTGLYEFLRMPFGLSNAPRTFQKAMNDMFEGHDHVKCFLDDILIHSANEEEHKRDIEKTLETLIHNHVIINIAKCNFYKDQVEYFGFLLDSKGIRPVKRGTINLLPEKKLNSKKALMQLLGTINWFRPFLRNLSMRILPLTEMLKEGNKISWNDAHIALVKEIEVEINKQPYLNHPDPSKPFILQTDSSNFGIGSVLKQASGIIGFFSKKLTEQQIKYGIMEKEAMAVFLSLKHWRTILYGCKIIIETDHSNLSFLSVSKLQRCQRWALTLSEYSYEICYIPGKSNNCADHLSRHPLDHQDKRNLQMINQINETTYETEIKKIHEEYNHPGCTRLFKTLKKQNSRPDLKNIVERVVKECVACQKFKLQGSKIGYLEGKVIAEFPFQKVAVDICGPFNKEPLPSEEKGEKFYVLTIMDIYTRWPEIHLLPDVQAKTVAESFEIEWLRRYPNPSYVLTDNGTQFISSTFGNLLQSRKIKHITTLPYNPRGNSKLERMHRELNSGLRIYQHLEVYKALAIIAEGQRKIFHSALGTEPAVFVFGREVHAPNKIICVREIAERKDQLEAEQRERNESATNKNRHSISLLGKKSYSRISIRESSPRLG